MNINFLFMDKYLSWQPIPEELRESIIIFPKAGQVVQDWLKMTDSSLKAIVYCEKLLRVLLEFSLKQIHKVWLFQNFFPLFFTERNATKCIFYVKIVK